MTGRGTRSRSTADRAAPHSRYTRTAQCHGSAAALHAAHRGHCREAPTTPPSTAVTPGARQAPATATTAPAVSSAPGPTAPDTPSADTDSTSPRAREISPVSTAPVYAVTRTAGPRPHEATATSAAAVTRSAQAKPVAEASTAHAVNTSGNCPATTAKGNGVRSRPSSDPYRVHTATRTADATAEKAMPSVPGAATACSAIASSTVSSNARTATASAVEGSPRPSSSAGATSAPAVTTASTAERPAMPISPQLKRVKAIAATASSRPPSTSRTFCVPRAGVRTGACAVRA